MIVRIEKTGNYSKVSNGLWTDKRLSVTARFILGFMLSLPDDWRFNIAWIAKQIGLNRDTVSKYINELIDNGFIMRERQRHEDGTFGDYDYTVYEEPFASTYAESTCAELVRTTKTDTPLTKTKKEIVVVEPPAKVIEYPLVIIESLSRHDLSVNAATLKRWLSLASEEIIVQVIESAISKDNLRNVIAWITGVLQQGFTQGYVREGTPKIGNRRTQPVRSDKLPHYVQRQINGEVRPVGELSEEQRREAARLLAALGEG